MSKTKRNFSTLRTGKYSSYLRKPRTLNEIKQLSNLLVDNYLEDIKLGKLNRVRKRLTNIPVYWDDKLISAVKEISKEKCIKECGF